MNHEQFSLDSSIHADASNSEWTPLPVLQQVIGRLEQDAISCCHWKSNYHLEYALTGVEDVDVLIAQADFPRFVQILLDYDFKQAESVTKNGWEVSSRSGAIQTPWPIHAGSGCSAAGTCAPVIASLHR